MSSGIRIFLLACSGVLTFLVISLGWTSSPLRSVRLFPHDKPAATSAWFLSQRAYPMGHIPADWYQRARDHVAGMPDQFLGKKTRQDVEWISLGPSNIAGRIRALAIDPGNPAVLYAGSAGGGVWKSTNAGLQWTPLTDMLPNLRIGSLAVDPHQPGRVFAGCGEGFVAWQGMLAFGQGIYRTEDGGSHWDLLPSTNGIDFQFVFDVAVDPFQANTVLACTNRGIFLTTNAGTSWKRVVVGNSSRRGMQCSYHRTQPGVVYGATESNGILRSTDHGATWTLVFNGASLAPSTRIVLAPAPSNGDIVYAAFTKEEDESCAGMLRSTDRGDTWTSITIPRNRFDFSDYMGQQGQYNSVLAVHPTNPAILWAGGIDLYRSTNSGQSWTQMTNWYEGVGLPYVHADQHALLFHPNQPALMFAACDGGIFSSVNGGSSWDDRNRGLVTAQFHSGSPHPTADLVIGGTIDNGNLKVVSGTSWMDVTGGDGGYTAVDYLTPSTWYAELYYLHFMKSTEGGVDGSFQLKMNGIPRAADYGTSDPVNFIAPFEMDPVDPRVLYAGTDRVYRTTNAAENWKSISPVLAGSGVLSAIGLSSADRQVVYAGGTEGTLSMTSDGGTTWTSITAGLPNRYITDIAVDAGNAYRAFVGLSGFGTGHLFCSDPLTMRWSDISGLGSSALPDAPVNCVLVHPSNPDRIFVGTDVGVFYTNNRGEDWMPMNNGIGNVTIADLQLRRDGVLFVATHGRGMYRSAGSVLDSQQLAQPRNFSMEQNIPNPVTQAQVTTTIRYSMPSAGTAFLGLFDARGSLVRQLSLDHPVPGVFACALPVSGLASGVYYYTLTFHGVRLPAKKMIVLR